MAFKIIKKEIPVTTTTTKDVPVCEIELDPDFGDKSLTEQFEFLRGAMKEIAKAHEEAGIASEVDDLVDRIGNIYVDWYTSQPSCW